MTQKYKLNSAGQLARSFINSALTVPLILAIILFGILALTLTPRTYNPEIIVPVVNISVSRPGSDANEMLNQVVRPLEALMASIPGVKHTFGMALDDSALVTVRFKVNEDEQSSLVKVYNQINSNIDRMPPGTKMPLIRSVSLYDIPLVTFTLYSNDHTSTELREIASKLLERLRSIPSVGKSSIVGASPRAIRVWLDPDKILQHHISIESIQQSLSINNTSLNAGDIEHKLKKIPVRIEGSFISANEIKNIIVGTDNAKPILLKDIAQIVTGSEDSEIRSYFSFGKASHNAPKLMSAATITLARQKGSNGVDVSNALLRELELLKENHMIPAGVNIAVTRNYGDDANDAVNTLVEHLGIAIIAVVFLLLIFLGWREASIVIFSIPLILCVVLGVGWVMGQTINRITLFALILSLGLLVDDSIVVIENIHRHIHKGIQKNFARLILFAAHEVGKPTIIATFTVMLALLPMAFVSGMMGPFMAPIPFNAPLAMLVSLVIAYTVVPYLAYRFLRKRAKSHHQHNGNQGNKQSRLQMVYLAAFKSLLHSPTKRHVFYGLIVIMLGAVMIQPLWQFIRPAGANAPLSRFGVELKMLPDDNVNTLLLEINSGINSTSARTMKTVNRVTAILNKNQFIKNYQVYLGEGAPEDFAAMARADALKRGSQYAQIRVNLVNKHDRTIGSHKIAQQLWSDLATAKISDSSTKIKLYESPPGPPVRSQMEAGLYGKDYDELRHIAENITTNIYTKIYGMINADNSVSDNTDKYSIVINHNATVKAGLIPQRVAENIAGYFKGSTVGSTHQPGKRESEHIIMRLPPEARDDVDILKRLFLKNQQARLIPLSSIATIQSKQAERPIYTRDQNPVVTISGEMLHSSPAYAVMTTTKMLHQLETPIEVGNLGFKVSKPQGLNKIHLLWHGEMRLTLDVFRDLGTAFIIALVLIYILLAGFYQSFITQLIIMGAIPLTLIGVFPGHWLMNQPFTATSMIGVIALAGIVVRNSLLLIDFIIEHQRTGYTVEEAVTSAGTERIMPILLTALAIILGSWIMLSDPVFGGLAVSLIFGSLASTILTLFLIPLLYLSYWKRTHKQQSV